MERICLRKGPERQNSFYQMIRTALKAAIDDKGTQQYE